MREDLITQLLIQLHNKANPEPTNKNSVLQKFAAPTEFVGLDDPATVTKRTKANFKWGGRILGTFSRASVAYDDQGNLVASGAPRFAPGAPGFGQALKSEEGTANVMGASATDFSLWTRADVTLTSGQSDPFGSTAATKAAKGVTTSPDPFYRYPGAQVAAGATVTYTASIWLRADAALTAPLVVYLAGVGAYAVNVSVTTQWQRFTFTQSLTNGLASAANVGMGLRLANSTTVYVFRAQFEAKPYATSFADGTRAAESFTIPTAGVLSAAEGNVEFHAWIPDGPQSYLFTVDGATDNRNRLFIYGTSTGSSDQAMRALMGDGTTSVVTPNIAVTRKAWHYFAVRWTATLLQFTVDTTTVQIARSGWAPTFGASAYIGSSIGASQANAYIDDLRISSRARTDAEILAAYQSGAPLPWDEDTTCKLDFDGSLDSSAYLAPGWVWNSGEYK